MRFASIYWRLECIRSEVGLNSKSSMRAQPGAYSRAPLPHEANCTALRLRCPVRASQKLANGLFLTLPNSPRACHLRPDGAVRRPAVVCLDRPRWRGPRCSQCGLRPRRRRVASMGCAGSAARRDRADAAGPPAPGAPGPASPAAWRYPRARYRPLQPRSGASARWLAHR